MNMIDNIYRHKKKGVEYITCVIRYASFDLTLLSHLWLRKRKVRFNEINEYICM